MLTKIFWYDIIFSMVTVVKKRLTGRSPRFSLIVLTACLALTAVFAEFFVFTHLDHDCIGENCSVCLQIEIAQSLLEGLGRIGIIVLGIVFFAKTKKNVKNTPVSYIFTTSPILLKVKSLS
jgi:multidrug transporter EmrE-like cation transporter